MHSVDMDVRIYLWFPQQQTILNCIYFSRNCSPRSHKRKCTSIINEQCQWLVFQNHFSIYMSGRKVKLTPIIKQRLESNSISPEPPIFHTPTYLIYGIWYSSCFARIHLFVRFCVFVKFFFCSLNQRNELNNIEFIDLFEIFSK